MSIKVVISKLRPSDHHQKQNVNLRAAKALIIIVPLLGITYLVTIVGPSEPDTPLETIFILTRNVLLSFQVILFLFLTINHVIHKGFIISLPYCFLNSEVCTIIKNHWRRWWMIKDIGQPHKSARNFLGVEGFNNISENLGGKR